MISAKWQATGCPEPPWDTSGGSSCAQISFAFQQRVRKRQPDGGLAGLGTSPSSMILVRLPRWSGDSIGTADSSACVYGCIGVAIDLLSRSDLDHLAEIHDGDPVGDVPDDREVVRDEEVREAELVL